MSSGCPVVVAFDLDGTLTRRDTLLPFLAATAGRARTARAMFALSLQTALVLAGRGSRDAAKERLLMRLLAGLRPEDLEATARAFVERLVERGLRPWAAARLQWHREHGHEVVIVTASPEIYVAELARRLGAAAVLGTRLEVDDAGRLTGRLMGANCRGAEKVARLRAWLGTRDVVLIAYGDSKGDRELLARADVGLRVRRGVPPQPDLSSLGS